MGLIPVLPTNVELIVIAIALVYTCISIIAQRTLTNPKRMREIQYKVKIIQKEMNDMMKNKAPNEQLMEKQKEFMPLMGEQMKNSMKPMLVIFPMLLLVYYVVFPMLPLGGTANAAGGKTLFIIIVFAIGFAAAIAIMIYDRAKAKQEQKEWDAQRAAST